MVPFHTHKRKQWLIILKVSYLGYAYSLILTTRHYSRNHTIFIILNVILSIILSHLLCEFQYNIILKTGLIGYSGNIQRQEKEKSENNLEKAHSYLLVLLV